MIIILNKRAVVTETIREARRALSMVLRIPERFIMANGEMGEDGKLHTEFSLDPDVAKGIPQPLINEVIIRVWLGDRKPMLLKRLAHVGDRRG